MTHKHDQGDGPTNLAWRVCANWHPKPCVTRIANDTVHLIVICETCRCVANLEACAERETWSQSHKAGVHPEPIP